MTSASCAIGTEGGQNLRDLGGHRTHDGRVVRRGLIFRSGTLHFLTERDHAFLQSLDIRTVCDFRSAKERSLHPVRWPDGKAPRLLTEDRGRDISIAPSGPGTPTTGEEAQRKMVRLYGEILADHNHQYRQLFVELLTENVPLIFNCTAGKDRTGVAAALVLSALGVTRGTIIEEYLLSNRYFNPTKITNSMQAETWQLVPTEVLSAYRAADEIYLQAVFDKIDKYPGGEPRFFEQELGVTESDLRKLRALYTQ